MTDCYTRRNEQFNRVNPLLSDSAMASSVRDQLVAWNRLPLPHPPTCWWSTVRMSSDHDRTDGGTIVQRQPPACTPAF